MLSHIIPCCRKDKSKRDFIESLLSKQDVDEDFIMKIEQDIKFDEVQAPATEAKLKAFSQFRISENQVGISSVAVPAFSPANELRTKLRHLFHYHQFKKDPLITSQFLPRRNFAKHRSTTNPPSGPQSMSQSNFATSPSMELS